jgi:hypothetical protein
MTELQRKPGYTAIATGMIAFARVDHIVRRGMDAARRGLGALLAESMTPEELRALSVRLYGTLIDASSAQRGLWDWEERWYAARLPAAPARLLVGGAGAGREAVRLLEHGYHVDGLEPSARLCTMLADVLGPSRLAVNASYEELARALLDGDAGEAAVLRGRRYDAVILGWGSFTHVLLADERQRALEACARLTDGPILASFWMRDESAEAGSWGRAARVGKALGRGLGRLRLGGQGAPGEQSAFGHAFRRAELEELAAGIERDVHWEGSSGVYPHATLVKRA